MKRQTLITLLNSYSEFLRLMPEDETAYEICEQLAALVVRYQARLSTDFKEIQEAANETL